MPDPRDLLHRLADELGDVEPPPDLVSRGRRRHRRRVLGATSGAALAVVAVVAAALLVPVHRTPSVTASRVPREATAAALRNGSWTVGPASPLGPRNGATLTWTGKEVLEVGGSTAAEARHGAAYDSATSTWRALPEAPPEIGSGRGAGQVWVDGSLFVLAGAGDDRALPHPAITALSRAVLYHPADDSWSLTAESPLGPVLDPVVVAVGSRVLVAAATPEGALAAAWYDTRSDRWTRVDPPPIAEDSSALRLTTVELAAVDTPAGVLLWALWAGYDPRVAGPAGAAVRAGVDVLRLTDRWSAVTGTWPQNRTVGQPQVVDGHVLLTGTETWCGRCPGPYVPGGPAQLVDPVSLTASTLPAGPLDAVRPATTPTGPSLLAVNLGTLATTPDGGTLRGGELAVLDLAAGRWDLAAPAPVPLAATRPPVWTGTSLVALAADGRLLTFRAAP